jgi:hypothetical protein
LDENSKSISEILLISDICFMLLFFEKIALIWACLIFCGYLFIKLAILIDSQCRSLKKYLFIKFFRKYKDEF